MEHTLSALHQFCQAHGRLEKILIVPSQYAGWQITNLYAKTYGSWINLHTSTLSALVDEVLFSTMFANNRKAATRFQTLTFTAIACKETIPEDGYFSELKNRLGFHKAMESTLTDLSETNTTGILLKESTRNRKFTEIGKIAKRYREQLNEAKLWLPAERISLAIEVLRKISKSSRQKRNIAVLGELTLSKLEFEFLELFTANDLTIFPQERFEENIENLKFDMFRAIGEENEVRHVVRTLLTDGIPFDSVELLYTESSNYLPLIYQLSIENEIPATFSSGLPISTTTIGQAAMGFLNWLRSDYSTTEFYHLLQLPCIRLDEISGSSVSYTLRTAKIGQGLARFQRQLEIWDKQLLNPTERVDENGETVAHKGRQQRLQGASRFIRELLALVPERKNGNYSFPEIAISLRNFLSRFTRIVSESDSQALEILNRLLDQIIESPRLFIPANEAISEILTTIRDLHWGAELPKPGKLHVSHFRSGGYSGREHTFLIGMDEGRFPGSENLDPILLDTERVLINETRPAIPLQLSSAYAAETERELDNCIARIRGSLTVGYSCYDLLENREVYPATKLLQLYRMNHRVPESDYAALESAIGEPIGFTDINRISTSQSEYYLQKAVEYGNSFRETILQKYPLLQEGETAANSRLNLELTPFDGWLNFPHPTLDPRITGEAVSATRLMQLSKCAYAYFLQYVLQIEPTEELERDPLEWLDALEYGRLLHSTFHHLMLEITQNNLTPGELSLDSIQRIVQSEIQSEILRNPPSLDINVSDVQSKLLRACQLFLRSEQERFDNYEPRYFELSFGIPKQVSDAEFDSSKPVPLLLANQTSVNLRGIIDRVNRLRKVSNEYEIIDYKSGSDYSFSSKSAYNKGRQLQHGLYALALEMVFRENNLVGQVVQSGYFFPTKKAAGRWITFPMSDANRQQVLDIVSDLCDILEQSAFLRTDDAKDCKYCEYRSICGDVDTVCNAASNKLANSHKPLEPLLRLRTRD